MRLARRLTTRLLVGLLFAAPVAVMAASSASAAVRPAGSEPLPQIIALSVTPTTLQVGQQLRAVVSGCHAHDWVEISLRPSGHGFGSDQTRRTDGHGHLVVVRTLTSDMVRGPGNYVASAACLNAHMTAWAQSHPVAVRVLPSTLPFTGGDLSAQLGIGIAAVFCGLVLLVAGSSVPNRGHCRRL
jgi:hypothetical protein